jgi:hypothetical protein
MPFGTMVSCDICALTPLSFLLLHTPYAREGMVTYERTERDRRAVLDKEVTIDG